MERVLLQGTDKYIWSTADTLGTGATGNVYKARHKKTGDEYAVKTFNANSFARPYTVQLREFEVTRRLNHPNIVKMLAVEEEVSTQDKVIVMELCTGGSLYTILQDEPQNAYGLPDEEFLTVVKDVAAGMKHLRDENIVHRDIKPGNILRYITEDGRSIYKLTDFGAARELRDEEQFMSLYGTEEYLHPDIYERAVLRRSKGQQFKATVDLWSLGVTFYHVATGHLPFRPYGGRQNKETMHTITTDKESGVISGVQTEADGPIKWSRELPSSCILSQGLQNLIAPMLAHLLETCEDKLWTFDAFFQAVTYILDKAVIHVFAVPMAAMLRIYILDKDSSLATFQELIAQQTDIPASQQRLLVNNSLLEDSVEPTGFIQSYPRTDINNPIYLFPKDFMEFPKLPNHSIPSFPSLNVKHINLEYDATASRFSCEIMYLAKLELENNLRREELLKKAVKMLIHVYSGALLCLHTEVEKQVREHRVHKQQESTLVECHKREIAFLHLVNKQFTDLPEDIYDMELKVDEMVDDCISTLKEVDSLLVSTESDVNKLYYKYVKENKLQEHWDLNAGTEPGDDSFSVMNQLVAAIHKNMKDFKLNSAKVKLKFHEDQIHRFEKQKLHDRCTKGMNIFIASFLRLKDVYNQIPQWFFSVCNCQNEKKKADQLVDSLANSAEALTEKLDLTVAQYGSTMDEVLSRLQQESEQSSVNHDVTMPMNPASLDSWSNPSFDSSKQNSLDAIDSNVKMKELCDGLKSLESNTEGVKSALTENKELLAKLKSLQVENSSSNCPPDDTLDSLEARV